MDSSQPYNQTAALKEAWQQGYDFAQQETEEQRSEIGANHYHSGCYFEILMNNYQWYLDKQHTNKKTFLQWLPNNLVAIIDEDQFAEPESFACPARDKYYSILEWIDIEEAFYAGGLQGVKDYFKNTTPITVQEARNIGIVSGSDTELGWINALVELVRPINDLLDLSSNDEVYHAFLEGVKQGAENYRQEHCK